MIEEFIEDAHLRDILSCFLLALESKSPDLCRHSLETATLAAIIGERLAMEDIPGIYVTGMLHDLGKLNLSDAILLKRGPLTARETEAMQQHPLWSSQYFSSIPGLKSYQCSFDMIEAIETHHEEPDGKGYPYGYANGKILFPARIISIADRFSALISTRPYKGAYPPVSAIKILSPLIEEFFDGKGSVVKESLLHFTKKGKGGNGKPHLLSVGHKGSILAS